MTRLSRGIARGVLALVLTALCAAAVAQQADFQPGVVPLTELSHTTQASVAEVLRSLASRAGLVFVGQVESITPRGGVMEIVFSVQKQVLGDVGSTYTLREWAGQWAGGQQRYRVGQRAMVFLYAANAGGLSSPVDGMAGVVPLIPMDADVDPLIDVRWLAAKVARPVGKPIADADFGAMALADAAAVVANWDRKEPQPKPEPRPLPVGLRPRPVLPFSGPRSFGQPLQPGLAQDDGDREQ